MHKFKLFCYWISVLGGIIYSYIFLKLIIQAYSTNGVQIINFNHYGEIIPETILFVFTLVCSSISLINIILTLRSYAKNET
jgi:hypothetical protein